MLSLSAMYSQIDEFMGINSDDTVFDKRFYYDIIIATLEQDLRNEYNRTRTFNEFTIQTLNCVEVEIVDSSTCCDGLLPTGCKVLRTKNQLPTPVEFHQRDGIISIRPNDVLSKNIIYTNIDRIPYIKSDGINNTQLYAFIWDKYLYLYSTNPKYYLIESISLRGLFVDPVKAAESGCSGSHCMDDNTPFPISLWMWESLTRPKVLQKLLGKKYIEKDETNNSKDDQIQNLQMKNKQ